MQRVLWRACSGVLVCSALAVSQAQAPEVRSVGTLEQRVRRVVVSPSGRHLAMTTPDSLLVMDVASGKTWTVLGRQSTARLEFDELDWAPRGGLISFNRHDPSLDGQSFWVLPMDEATGQATGSARRVTEHVGDRHAVSPDGQSIAFADYGPKGSQRIVLVSIKDGAERMLTGEREAIYSVSWSDDGKWVYFSAEGRGPVHRVSLEGGPPEIVSTDLRWATLFRPGPAIAVTETDGSVRILDAVSGAQRFLMPYSGRGTDRVSSSTRDGSRLYAVRTFQAPSQRPGTAAPGGSEVIEIRIRK